MIYLRPEREALDRSIAVRSNKIVRDGLEEARKLERMIDEEGASMNQSVQLSIGVKELMETLSGDLTTEEAEMRISSRTRKLARRQMRWFDKLTHTLQDRADISLVRTPDDVPSLESILHIIEA
jgi:tRNA dimethylallyltransferase